MMVQNQTEYTIPSEEQQALRESVKQDAQRALQEGVPGGNTLTQPGIAPRYPEWPTSKRGPRVTAPPPGMRSINAVRREQVAEVGYNQETGEPAVESPARSLPDASQGPTSFDQPSAQEAISKRKQRIE